MLRPITTIAAGVALTCAAVMHSYAADKVPPYVSAAVSDAARPQADTQRDADRKPGDVIAFSGLKAGDKVADIIPGGGYFTRIFSKAVGAKGKVYAIMPAELLEKRPAAADGVKAIAADAGYANVSVVTNPIGSFTLPEPVDVAWTSLNYHDVHNPMFGGNPTAFNKAVFQALKPGGTFVVLDHAAAKGSGVRDTETLHRIDPDVVKKEILAAGFVLDGESDALRHSDDDHTKKAHDIRGKTDQFIFKFRRPAK